MADKMLIDASHEEETRVVVVRGNRIEEFDFESQHKKQIRGNIYLAKVTRVEPSLQAAFVDYGGNRHGFLAFAEIHPDYYQIPLADRQALLRAEAEEHDDEDDHDNAPASADLANQEQPDVGIAALGPVAEAVALSESDDGAKAADAAAEDAPAAAIAPAADAENAEAVEASAEEAPAPVKKPRVRRPRKKATEEAAADAASPESEAAQPAPTPDETAVPSDVEAPGAEDGDDTPPGHMAAIVETDSISEDVVDRRHDEDEDDHEQDHEDDMVESVGAEDAMEEVPDRSSRSRPRKQYRIQEVIKRRQILLVQVAKEERGNKGAALTTYLSLAGRYSVLMPNTARGGGISRKITNPADRKRLKDIAKMLEVPNGMGVILRTAGANRTKVEVKRDFEYLMRLWENVRTLTLNSIAPCLVYEEGSLIKRSIRDLYNKDIGEVIVAGEDGYREAKDFMRMLMPSHAKVVQPYRDIHPIFARSGIEAQLDRMLQPQVTLKSGGYLIINQTEALVAIDVNSGRSTREHSIEETALQTNLEAAEEVARQLRLRDLAGLVVIDFIDMEEKRNNRAVEKKMKDCLKNDRARIQVGRISHFGLLEMSRQRIRASVLESTTQICSHCGGTGHVRSQSSVALHVLRGVEEHLLKNTTHNITVRTTPDIALYLLNHKRQTIIDYEKRFGVEIIVDSDPSIGSAHFAIDRGEAVENPVKIDSLINFAHIEEEEEDDIVIEADDEEDEDEEIAAKDTTEQSASRTDSDSNRKRKRRRRRRGRNGHDEQEAGASASEPSPDGSSPDLASQEEDGEDEAGAEASAQDDPGDDENGRRRRRRRGKRGGRRNRDEDAAEEATGDASGTDADAPATLEIEALETEAEIAAAPEEPEEPGNVAASEEPAAPEAQADAVETPAPSAPAQPEPAPVENEPAQDTLGSGREEAEKPARANRESNVTSSEPVVTSNRAGEADKNESEPAKPRKAGWWQRRGFL